MACMNLEQAFEKAADAMSPVLNNNKDYNLQFLKGYGGDALVKRYVEATKVAIETFMKELDE